MGTSIEDHPLSDGARVTERRGLGGWRKSLFGRARDRAETCPRAPDRPCAEGTGPHEGCTARLCGCPLAMADEGVWLKVVAIRPGRGVQHRLIELGLTVGARICVLQRGGTCPMLIGVGDSRLALGHGLAGKIMVEPANDDPHAASAV